MAHFIRLSILENIYLLVFRKVSYFPSYRSKSNIMSEGGENSFLVITRDKNIFKCWNVVRNVRRGETDSLSIVTGRCSHTFRSYESKHDNFSGSSAGLQQHLPAEPTMGCHSWPAQLPHHVNKTPTKFCCKQLERLPWKRCYSALNFRWTFFIFGLIAPVLA